MAPAPDIMKNGSSKYSEGEDTCGPFSEQEKMSMVDYEKRVRDLMLRNCDINPNETPLFPRFANLDERLRSFKNWPAGTGVTPEALSKAGLFYSSHGDRTFCFQCGGTLEGWCASDIPLTEHSKWYPSCKFINSIPENMIINDPYVIEFRKKARTENDLKIAFQTIRDLISSIDMTKVSPRDIQSTIETLKVIVSEVDAKTSRIQEEEVNELSDRSSGVSSESCSPSRSSISCVICLTGPRNALLLPCHHIATCVSCASKLKMCCVCRLPVTYHTRVYIS